MRFLIFLVVSLFGFSCQSHDEMFNTKDYICPNLDHQNKIFYEYTNDNESFSNIKYLMLEKDSVFDNIYTYIFLDKRFEKLSGYHEIRTDSSTTFDKMIFLEQGINNERIINEIQLDSWNFPFLFILKINWFADS